MKQPKKLIREHKIEIAKKKPDLDLSKYRLVSMNDNEFVLTDSETNTERIVISR